MLVYFLNRRKFYRGVLSHMYDVFVGQEFKNYKDMCLHIGITPKGGGESLKSQKNELKTHFEWEKVKGSNKVRITKLHTTEETIKLKSKIKRGGNNRIFVDDFEQMLIHMLLTRKQDHVLMARGSLYRAMEMVNDNYLIGRKDIVKLARAIDVPTEAVSEFYDANSSKIRKIIETGFKNFRNKTNVTVEEVVAVCAVDHVHTGNNVYSPKLNYRPTTVSEKHLIMECEDKAIKIMGFKNKRDVFMAGQWKKFKQESMKYIRRKNKDIKFYYDAYAITYLRDSLVEEYNSMKINHTTVGDRINTNMMKSIVKSSKGRNTRAINGSYSVKTPKHRVAYRTSDTYLAQQEHLTSILIDKNASEIIIE